MTGVKDFDYDGNVTFAVAVGPCGPAGGLDPDLAFPDRGAVPSVGFVNDHRV